MRIVALEEHFLVPSLVEEKFDPFTNPGFTAERHGVRRVVILSSIAFPATLFCLSFAPTFGVALALGFAAGLVGCGVSQYSCGMRRFAVLLPCGPASFL